MTASCAFAAAGSSSVGVAPLLCGQAATLQAIHLIENPHNSSRPGPRGELGAYQFRESTWRRYSHEPFSRALNRRASDAVAQRHYAWIEARLEANGVEPTPYNIALAWNAGLSAAIRGKAPRAARDYAERAANLAADLAGQTLASR